MVSPDSEPVLNLCLGLQDAIRDLSQVDADYVGALEERVQDHAWPRHERRPATGLHGPGHVPSMGRDEPDLPDFDPQTIRCHAIRLGRRLQPLDGVSGEYLIKVSAQTRIVYLGVGHALRRVR